MAVQLIWTESEHRPVQYGRDFSLLLQRASWHESDGDSAMREETTVLEKRGGKLTERWIDFALKDGN